MADDAARMERAIEVFARGVAYTRSLAYPCAAERVGPLWVTRDGPRKRGVYRNEEWAAWRMAPVEVDRLARQETRGRFAVCAIHAVDEPDGPLRADYKKLGYRLLTSEPLMVHDLRRVPRCPRPAGVSIERVTSAALAERLAQATRRKASEPELLRDDAPLRQYGAETGGALVGWVRSIVVGDATWCASTYVVPAYRRRGIARALLSRMLRDDRAGGSRLAVLLASHVGAKLYPVVGYEQIGTLLLLTPPKK
jgi:GNAT superfamily N-acetyltransferase